jgi:predicted RNase H-like HicB family nuclease
MASQNDTSLSNVHALVRLEYAREEDGRWIAEALDIPGVLAYGTTQHEAGRAAFALALRVLADRVEARANLSPVVEANSF